MGIPLIYYIRFVLCVMTIYYSIRLKNYYFDKYPHLSDIHGVTSKAIFDQDYSSRFWSKPITWSRLNIFWYLKLKDKTLTRLNLLAVFSPLSLWASFFIFK